jgi:CHAT domain-containing protein/Flp pilus assembly protein TadD
LEAVSTTCGSGWVNRRHSKAMAISHADHRPTRYRGVVLTVSITRLARALILLLVLAVSSHGQNPPAITQADLDDLVTTLVTLHSQQEREQLLDKNRALVTPDLRKALISRGNAQLLAGRYSTAFEIYGIAQNIAAQIGDKEGVATAWLDIGTVYYFQANYPAALEHYQKARDLFTEVTNHYESAKALSGLALIYKEQRRETEALAALQQVLKEFTALGDKEEMANALSSIGAIYYGQGNYSAAAEAFRKSSETNSNVDSMVRLADALYMQGDYMQASAFYKQSLERVASTETGTIVAALNGAANSTYYMGNYDDALRYYQRSVNIQKTLSDKMGLAIALKGVGNVYRVRGDYGAALENYFSSLSISEQIKAPLGSTLGSIGLVRALQGNYTSALEYYDKALKEFEANSNDVEMARALTLIGNVHYQQGQYDSALTSFQRALALREQMDDKPGQGEVLAGIGSTLLRQRKYSDAVDSFQKALGLFNSMHNKQRMADVLTRVSEAFLLQNEPAKALSAAESAVTLATEQDDNELLWYARMMTGKAHAKLEHETQAYQAFTSSIASVEALRAEASVIAVGDHNRTMPYLGAIDFLMSQHRPSEAFHYAERAKTQRLIDLLKNSNATTYKGLSDSERLEEQRLSGELASIAIQLVRAGEQRASNEARLSVLRDRLRTARADYAAFRQKLIATHPELKIARGELPPLTLGEIRSLVTDTSTALLEYTITENNTYLFVLTVDKTPAQRSAELNLKVYPLEIKYDELASRVKNLRQLITSRADGFHEAARELYEVLLMPAEDQITLKTKLVIVPDGLLWGLPFEALQPAENHYVLDQMQVSYAPSLSALREMRKQRTPVNTSLIAYGNPSLSKEFSTRVQLAYSDARLESGADQEEEVKSLATGYGKSASRLRTEASEDRLKSDLSRAKIVHLAAPAMLDDASPMSSFIGLASGTGEEDGFLQARELMNLRSTAELVVASRAQHNADLDGAAPLGFSWSWFVAGTSATMVTRWNVDSAALSTILTEFYSSVRPTRRPSISKARALHQSLLSLRKSNDYQHPYYWASFALIGDAR